LRGKALDAAIRQQTSRHIRLASLMEQLPDPDNRVTLDPQAKDIYGVPLPRLAYRLDDYVKAGLAAARSSHGEIFARLGATEVQPVRKPGSGHIISTAPWGAIPDLRRRPRPAQPDHGICSSWDRGVSDVDDQSDADHRSLEPAGAERSAQ
jgi:choline dehydrogenase-like flavoprotein